MKEIDKWEDIKNSFPYLDILEKEPPISKKHPKQPMEARAAQFSPFAALTGYEDAIKEVSRYTEEKISLEEEAKNELDQELQKIEQRTRAKITIVYFEKDPRKKGGKYKEIQGIFQKIDREKRILFLEDKTKISLEDIVKIES